jgi:hypothetical protein
MFFKRTPLAHGELIIKTRRGNSNYGAAKSSGNSKYGAAKSPGLGQFPSSNFFRQINI